MSTTLRIISAIALAVSLLLLLLSSTAHVLTWYINDGKYVALLKHEYGRISTMSACHKPSYPQIMTRFLRKFFLSGACSSSTSRRFSTLTMFSSNLIFRTQLSIGWRIITHVMKLHYNLFNFLNVICCSFCYLCHSYCRLCRSYCRSLLFILSFIAIFYRFLIVCLSFFSVILQ